jgi:hypothetical protein
MIQKYMLLEIHQVFDWSAPSKGGGPFTRYIPSLSCLTLLHCEREHGNYDNANRCELQHIFHRWFIEEDNVEGEVTMNLEARVCLTDSRASHDIICL